MEFYTLSGIFFAWSPMSRLIEAYISTSLFAQLGPASANATINPLPKPPSFEENVPVFGEQSNLKGNPYGGKKT